MNVYYWSLILLTFIAKRNDEILYKTFQFIFLCSRIKTYITFFFLTAISKWHQELDNDVCRKKKGLQDAGFNTLHGAMSVNLSRSMIHYHVTDCFQCCHDKYYWKMFIIHFLIPKPANHNRRYIQTSCHVRSFYDLTWHANFWRKLS